MHVRSYAAVDALPPLDKRNLHVCPQVLQFITNHQMSDALFKRMSALKLLKPGDTRFATSFVMLQRMKAVKLKLLALLVDEEYEAWAGQRQYKEAADEAADTLHDREFWKQVCARAMVPIKFT